MQSRLKGTTFDFFREMNGAPAKILGKLFGPRKARCVDFSRQTYSERYDFSTVFDWGLRLRGRLALQSSSSTYLAWRPGCACKSLTNKRATAHSAALHGASAIAKAETCTQYPVQLVHRDYFFRDKRNIARIPVVIICGTNIYRALYSCQ